ncbi:MAG: damage-control phosphatase ARMT1 family protein [Anaerolineales bacterium]
MPSLQPPAPLRGQDGNGWARHSIVERLPEIGRRTLAETVFPPEIDAAIRALIEEIPDRRIQPIDDPGAPDAGAWQTYVEPHLDDDWLSAPWFFVETYFYRRLIAATGYFHGADVAHSDPFAAQKRQALPRANQVIEDQPRDASLQDLLLASLWANQADLSLWPHGEGSGRRRSPAAADERILIDQRDRIASQLEAERRPLRLDLILDNVGAELAADLSLTDHILASRDNTIVKLHAKMHPTFVSDATSDDVLATLDHWQESNSREIFELGQRLHQSMAADRLQLQAHRFWTSPTAGWLMPGDLRQELAGSDLLLFKGDANYRRLLGDRHWPWITPLKEIVDYLPAPAGALRSLKADVAAGLNRQTIERTSATDPKWMINGRWALVQFVDVHA